jgi:anti-anti-sigma factor
MQNISIRRDGHEATIAIHGDFVFAVNREFRDAYQALPPRTHFTVDFRQTNYIDSAGLGMLVQLREHAGGEAANVRLTGINDTIRNILDVANFSRLFRIE